MDYSAKLFICRGISLCLLLQWSIQVAYISSLAILQRDDYEPLTLRRFHHHTGAGNVSRHLATSDLRMTLVG